MKIDQPQTLIQALEQTARAAGDGRGITFYDSPKVSHHRRFSDLVVRARTIASALRAAGYGPGDTALVVLRPGLQWPDAVYGVLYAGMAVVPAPATNPGLADRIAGLARASAAAVVVTEDAVLEQLGADAGALGLAMVSLERLVADGDPAAWVDPEVDPSSLALMLFTSGSTDEPKGVIGTHGTILASAMLGAEALDFDESSTFAGWLPMHHALGILTEIFMPASLGARAVVTAPEQFQRRPMFWLRLISDHKATVTAAGNFAFGLCAKLATDAEVAALDLSSLRVTISGSEPVRPETVQAFIDRFAPAGFAASSVAPTLGMTETMFVAMKPRGEDYVARRFDSSALATGELVPSDGDATTELVSCGGPFPQSTLVVVDPDRAVPVAEGRVGELWISSPTVSPGYFGRPEATAETFGHRLPGDDHVYMRSGDLAAVLDGELYVTGRLKEVIIIRGRNIYPQDVEAAAAALSPALGIGAAFEQDGSRPGVGMVIEVDEDELAENVNLAGLAALIAETLTTQFSIPRVTVSLVRPDSLPRTATGKIRRKLTRTQLDRDELVLLAR